MAWVSQERQSGDVLGRKWLLSGILAMQSYKWLLVCLDTADQDFDSAEKLWLG
jgi:hypothetical protein